MPTSPALPREPVAGAPEAPTAATGTSYFALGLMLFAGSGCAALIYEVVWSQLVQLVIGASAVSIGLVLAAYMAGLCLGGALFARLVPGTGSPLRTYAWIELGIGAFGLLALFGIPLVGRLYLAAGFTGLLLRGIVAAVCLLPPTLLMGASLPALARWTGPGPRLGYLYSANIAGAITGCLAAGFYLLRIFDMAVATYAAVAINIAVALVALWLAPRVRPAATPREDQRAGIPGSRLIYAAIALSGLTALGAEVIWTRMLSLVLGATVYTFSIILAVFLLGLWGGSLAASAALNRLRDTRWALAGCQALLVLSLAWTAYSIAIILPHWPVDPFLTSDVWFLFDLDVTRTVRAILLPALLWGASFPLALAAVAKGNDPARFSGLVYAVNTAGSVIGALAFSLVLLPAIGTRQSEQLLVVLAALGSAFAAWAAPRPMVQRVAAVVALTVVAGLAVSAVPALPWQVMAYGRRFAPILRGLDTIGGLREETPLFVAEGISSSVVITQRDQQRFFHVSGKTEASTAPLDMRLQRMMGHLPALLHPNPRTVLVVGFGAGVTAGAFVPYRDIQQVTVCELEPTIPPASGRYFARESHDIITDRRLRLVYDDARHYVSAMREKFDVITTDPIHPWVKGTSTLYSKEYYELVKAHLNHGGIVAQWLPAYDSDEETVKTELATFFRVFPNGTLWTNHTSGNGYDMVLIGRQDDAPIDIDKLAERLNAPAYSQVKASLGGAGFFSAMELLGSYAGRAQDLQPWIAGTRINEDLNLRLQYVAGLSLNSVDSAPLYRKLLSYRAFPTGLFTGSAQSLSELRTLLEKTERAF